MKTIISIVCFSIILTGCQILRFDNVFYDRAIQLNVYATHSKKQCKNVEQTKINSDILVDNALAITQYAKYKKMHKDIEAIAQSIYKSVGEFNLRANTSPISVTYCQRKMEYIEKSTTNLLIAIGGAI